MEAAPGGTVETVIELERRVYELWDQAAYEWTLVPGSYEVQAARSLGDVRLTANHGDQGVAPPRTAEPRSGT